MKKFLTLTALALGLAATPALARCHGHSTADGHWDLNVNAWTNAELVEIGTIADKIKAIAPTIPYNPVEIAAVIDQYECSGVEHANAIKDVVGLSTARAALKGSN